MRYGLALQLAFWEFGIRVQLPGPRALLSYCLVRVGQLLMFTRLLWVLEEDIEILILDGRGEQGARVLGVV